MARKVTTMGDGEHETRVRLDLDAYDGFEPELVHLRAWRERLSQRHEYNFKNRQGP